MLGVFTLWSVIPVLVKLLFPVFDPFTIAFLRLLQGAAVVSAAFFARGHTLRDIQWSWWHVIGGLGMSLNFSLYAFSLSYTTASAGSLVVPGAIRRADGAGCRRAARAVGCGENGGDGAGAGRSGGDRGGARGCGPSVRTALCPRQCADAVRWGWAGGSTRSPTRHLRREWGLRRYWPQ